MTDGDIVTVVLDSGSRSCKAGFAGEDRPRVVFPSIIGRPLQNEMIGAPGLKNYYMGDEAQKRRGVLSISHPMERGTITNWDDMERIWHHVFQNELGIYPPEHSILLTEAVFTPKVYREKMLHVMFETFGFHAMYISEGYWGLLGGTG